MRRMGASLLQLSPEETLKIGEAPQVIELAEKISELEQRERRIEEDEIKIKRQEHSIKRKGKENKKELSWRPSGWLPATTFGWSA